MTPSNLAIFREQYAPRTTRVVNTPDGTVSVYSALAVGVIEGKSRTIRALVCEEIGTEDRWFLVTLFVQGKYAQTVAVLGATSSEQAEEWVKRQFSYEYQGEYTSACSLSSNGGPLTASADALQEYLDSAAAGVMDLPIRSADIAAFEGKITDRPVGWNQDILISHATLADLIHELARRDKHGMMMDAMTAEDLPFLVAELGGEVPEFDAIIVDYNRLGLMQERLMTAMHKASTGMEIKPMTVQQTKPFKRSGVTNVAVMYELSDGQTVTIVFHSPDATPAKLGPRDTLTSWKWMLNKRDVTAAVAPENGLNVQLPVLAKRIMMVAAKNSARFKRTNAKKSEQVQALNDTTSRIEQKTATLDGINAEIDTLQKQIDAGGNKISLTDITPDLLAKIPFGWGVSRGSDGLFFVTRFGRKYTVLNEKSVFSSANDAVEFAIDGDKTTDAPTQSEIEWAKKNGFVQVAPSGDDRNDAIDELAEIEMFKAVQNDDMAAAIATIEKAKAYGVDGVLKVLNTAYLNNLPMLSRIAKNYGISASGGAIPISAAVDDIVAAIMAGNVSSPSVPASVERQINAAVQNMKAKAKSLDQVIKVRGHGANLEQALAEVQPDIDSSMATIQKIRDAASNNGASEEVERLIAAAGGIPDFKQYQMPPDDGMSKDARDAIDSMLLALQDDQELKGRIEQAVARMNIADISGDMVENWYKANSRTYLSGLPMSQMMRAAAEFKRRAVDAVNSIGNGGEANAANDGRLTPDTAGNLKRGDVVKTADGQEFLALGARHDWLEVAPIVNGKAQVNNQDTFKFLLTPEKASSYPERRNEPVYPTGRNLYAEQEKAKADAATMQRINKLTDSKLAAFAMSLGAPSATAHSMDRAASWLIEQSANGTDLGAALDRFEANGANGKASSEVASPEIQGAVNNARPENWRTDRYAAASVASGMGIDTKGMQLKKIVTAIETKDRESRVDAAADLIDDVLADVQAPEGFGIVFDKMREIRNAYNGSRTLSGFIILQDVSGIAKDDLSEVEVRIAVSDPGEREYATGYIFETTGPNRGFPSKPSGSNGAFTAEDGSIEGLRSMFADRLEKVFAFYSNNRQAAPAKNRALDQKIKLVADSVEKVRKQDVQRLLESIEGNTRVRRNDARQQMGNYLKAFRPDLAEEVDSVLFDLQEDLEVEPDDLARFGQVEITSQGSENIYFTKDGQKYFSKVMNTERFPEGSFDLAANPNGLLKAATEPVPDPDRTLLEGIINGTTSAADVDMDALIAIAEKYDGNPDMEGLVNQALDIVTQAELEAAKAIG